MTPAQQTALETLYSRSLTPSEINAIAPLVNDRNDRDTAARLNIGRKRLVPTLIGNKDVLRVIGLQAGNALLDFIYTNPAFKYVIQDLERENLNIAEQMVIGTIDSAVPAVITVEQANALKNLAVVDDPIDFNAVADCLNGVN